jgi:maltooligosyltrehalose trehalohydrolase
MTGRRTIGLNYAGNKATFSTWAPNAISVQIQTPDAIVSLERRHPGFWDAENILMAPGASYSVIVDGKKLPDPASLFQPDSNSGDSIAFDLHAHIWHDNTWAGILTEDLIIYELHTGAFSPEGTFDGIAKKIEYLKELGITAIEIMPVAQFSGSRNWGYDGVFPFAVQNTYGGPAGLQRLVDLCHQNNISVILDVVLNHIGPEGNILPEFGPFFTDKYRTPWGQAINYDDQWSDGVRTFFIENVLMWLRDFHVDGLRLDALHAVKDFGPTNILQVISENVTMLNEATSANHFLIGECDLNDVRYIDHPGKGGYGIDAIWCDEFHHSLHSLLTGDSTGYYSDFGNVWHLVKSFNDAFVYDGIWSEHRKRIFGTRTKGFSGKQFVVFSQNHDQVGNRMLGERMTHLVSYEQLKLSAGAVLFSPYIPLLFMGEEYAEKNPFLYFTSHRGEELIRLVREGRIEEFTDFFSEGEAPDPQDKKTFDKSKLNPGNLDNLQSALLAYYKNLLNLRKTIPLWRSLDRATFFAESIEAKNVIQLTRKSNSHLLIAILNFEGAAVDVGICKPYTQWELLLNSGDIKWGGPGNTIDPEESVVTIPPFTMIILYSS